jgi:hypothetical protein
MDVAFSQFFAAIDIDNNKVASAGASANSEHTEKSSRTTSKSSRSQTVKKLTINSAINSMPVVGDMHILGDITRKLVITPDFLIGKSKDHERNTTDTRFGRLVIGESNQSQFPDGVDDYDKYPV